jgi:hypothetical protein
VRGGPTALAMEAGGEGTANGGTEQLVALVVTAMPNAVATCQVTAGRSESPRRWWWLGEGRTKGVTLGLTTYISQLKWARRVLKVDVFTISSYPQGPIGFPHPTLAHSWVKNSIWPRTRWSGYLPGTQPQQENCHP